MHIQSDATLLGVYKDVQYYKCIYKVMLRYKGYTEWGDYTGIHNNTENDRKLFRHLLLPANVIRKVCSNVTFNTLRPNGYFRHNKFNIKKYTFCQEHVFRKDLKTQSDYLLIKH
jgi:hypothetical protein